LRPPARRPQLKRDPLGSYDSMCLGVYLAAPDSLPEIQWSQERPAFNVGPITPDEASVRRHFSHPHVYYLGSHTQCGCGFSSREEPELADRRRSLESLQAYLADATLRGPVELFVCWDGDYAEDPRQRIQLQAKELAGRDDWLEDRTFVEVRGAAA